MKIPPYIWYPVLTSLGLGFMFMNIPPVSTQFMNLFNVGYGGLGLFLSGLYWTHSLFQVPSGVVVDRLGVVRSFVLAFMIIIVSNLLPFLAPESLLLAISMRFLLGIAAGIMFLAIIKTVGSLAPPNQLARAQGIQGASFSLGTMLPYCSLPYMGSAAWSYSYLLIVLFAVIALVGLYFMPRAEMGVSKNRPNSRQVWDAVKTIPKTKAIWILGCFHGLAYGSLNNLGNWLPSILADLDQVSTQESWAIAASAVILLGTLARAFGGELLRYLSRTQLVSNAIIIIAVLYLCLAFSTHPIIALGVCVVMAIVCGVTYGSVFTLTIGSVSPAYVATAVGFMNMVANLVNVSLILLLSNMREWTGHFTPSFYIMAVFAFLVWLVGRKFRLPERKA